MFPSNELLIQSISGAGGSGQMAGYGLADILSDYYRNYCESLVKRGYLKKTAAGRGYKLTQLGKDTFRKASRPAPAPCSPRVQKGA